MDDLINRAAAVEALDGAKVDEEYCTEYDIGYNDGIDFAVSRLSVLPSAQPTDADIQKMQDIEQAMLEKAYECGKQDAAQWIPCSERLPEDFQSFYATCRSNVDVRENWVIEGYYTPWRGFDPPPLVVEGKAEIIAWMPKELPEPYKEDSHETD